LDLQNIIFRNICPMKWISPPGESGSIRGANVRRAHVDGIHHFGQNISRFSQRLMEPLEVLMFSREEGNSIAPDEARRAVQASKLIWRRQRWEAPKSIHQRSLLIYVIRGALHCEADNNIWIAPPTTVLWLPANTVHTAYAYGDYASYGVWVDADPGMPKECCIASVTPLLRELILRASGFPEEAPADAHERRILDVILGEIALLPWENLRLPMPTSPRIRPLVEAMIANPAAKDAANEWGSRFGLSERTMSRLFIQDIGMSWGDWKRQLHVTLALQRMANGNSVQSVALSLGYESASSFIAMFKRTLGKPPGQYLAERHAKSLLGGGPPAHAA